jgi:hypothetical protein
MSNVTPLRGAVYAEEAYAQGKMLDNSSWRLPRNITPSDFDCVFDNRGRMVLAEFSSSCSEWELLSLGQRMAYMSAIAGTYHLAALCKHSVPKMRQINTRDDVDSFQIMFDVAGDFYVLPTIEGKHWPLLIDRWFKSPSSAITGLMRKNEIQKLPGGR